MIQNSWNRDCEKKADTTSSVQKVIKKWQLTGTVKVRIRSARPREESERAVGGMGRKGGQNHIWLQETPRRRTKLLLQAFFLHANLFHVTVLINGGRQKKGPLPKKTNNKQTHKQKKFSRLDFRITMIRADLPKPSWESEWGRNPANLEAAFGWNQIWTSWRLLKQINTRLLCLLPPHSDCKAATVNKPSTSSPWAFLLNVTETLDSQTKLTWCEHSRV